MTVTLSLEKYRQGDQGLKAFCHQPWYTPLDLQSQHSEGYRASSKIAQDYTEKHCLEN